MLCCIINSKSQWLKTKDLLFVQSKCPLRIVWESQSREATFWDIILSCQKESGQQRAFYAVT